MFLSRYNTFLQLFFIVFYLYTSCTFYYLCKLCLYDHFSSSSVLMNWLSCLVCFFYFRYVAYFLAPKQTDSMSTFSSCKVYIGSVIVLCWCYCLCNTWLYDAEWNYMALIAAQEICNLLLHPHKINSYRKDCTVSLWYHCWNICIYLKTITLCNTKWHFFNWLAHSALL